MELSFQPYNDEGPYDEEGNLLSDPIDFSFFDVARTLEDLYISYKGRFVMMTLPRRNSNSEEIPGGVFIPRYKDPKNPDKLIDQRITNKIVCGHLHGHYAICIYAGSASSKFMCFDVDDGSKETVRKVIDGLTSVGFPRERIYVSTSGGKGYHVEVFFASLMFTSDLRNIYNCVCASQKLNRAKVEFRPTAGQSIKLPLSVHRKTGNTCWYLDRETLEPIRNQKYIFQIEKVDHETALTIAKSLPCVGAIFGCDQEQVEGKAMTEKERLDFSDSYYPDLTEPGTRHEAMVQIVVFNRYRGIGEDRCRAEMVEWYRRQPAKYIGSGEDEVLSDLDKIIEWVYSESFVVGGKEKEVVFRRDDVRILLAQKKRVDRFVLFLIQYYTKTHGNCWMGFIRLSKLAGVSYKTAYTSVQRLIQSGWVDLMDKAKVRKVDGKFFGVSNRYVVSGRGYNWAAGQFEYMSTIPVAVRERVFGVSMSKDELSLGKPIDNKAAAAGAPDECTQCGHCTQFKELYAKTLTHFLEDKDLRKHLTSKEYKEIKENELR